MHKYNEQRNKLHGLMVKSSDMSYERKDKICKLLSKCLTQNCRTIRQACQKFSEKMDEQDEGAWICVIGKKFVANITHEPGNFIRLTDNQNHFVVFKIKAYVQRKKNPNPNSDADKPCVKIG